MSCALETILNQRLDSPENRQLLEELLKQFREDPQYFVILEPSLAVTLPKTLGFNEQVVRMTCDVCALDPLKECKFADVLRATLAQRTGDHHGSP